MSNEFETIVEMHRRAANDVEALLSERKVLQQDVEELRNKNQELHSENRRLKTDVEAALDGRVRKNFGDQNNMGAIPPMQGSIPVDLTERISEHEPKQGRPFETCPACGRRKP